MNVLRSILVTLALALTACALPAPSAEAARVHDRTHTATVRLDFDNGVCSAVAVGKSTLLTATHCLANVNQIAIKGDIIKVLDRVDDGNDHSLIRVNREFSVLARTDPGDIEQGELGRLWGNPAGQSDIFRQGYVAGYDGDGITKSRITLYDVNVFPGDSGAAIFNDQGEVVDVVSGIINLFDGHSYAKFAAAFPLAFTAQDWHRLTR